MADLLPDCFVQGGWRLEVHDREYHVDGTLDSWCVDFYSTDGGDCDGNRILDSEELDTDCNDNGTLDRCDVAASPVQGITDDRLEDGDNFGAAIAASGNVVMIGAPRRTQGSDDDAGGVFVYSLDDGEWLFEQELADSALDAGDRFGSAVAMDGDVAVIGARGTDAPESDQGVAYVYRYDVDKDSWQPEGAALEADDAAASDWFGTSVDISGDVIVVGSYRSDPDDSDGEELSGAGAAYVYRLADGKWSQEAKLVASDRSPSDEFGRSVSVSGGTILVGAPGNDDDGTDSGSAYIFRYDGGEWEQDDTILTSNDNNPGGARFGFSVNLNREVAIVGAPLKALLERAREECLDLLDVVSSAGAAYVFRFTDQQWTQEARLTDPRPSPDARFGNAVAVLGDLAVIGAPDSDGQGVAYTFRYDEEAEAWDASGSIVGSADEGDGTETGAAVAAARFLVVAGAPGTDGIGTDLDVGAAHIQINIDCNGNGLPDSCDIADGTSADDDLNGIPDECEQTVAAVNDFKRGDANNDGRVSGLADGLFLLTWQFLPDEAVPPPSPGPDECGSDPDRLDDGIGCEETSDACRP